MFSLDWLILVAFMGTVLLLSGVAAWLVVYLSRRVERSRSELVAQIASSLGFSFEAQVAAIVPTGLAVLPLFQRGHARKTRNFMRKPVQMGEVTLFDFEYIVGVGKYKFRHRHTVAAFRADTSVHPDFELYPKSIVHRLSMLFGSRHILLDSHPAFSDSYVLRGDDADAVQAMFSAQILQFLEDDPGWSIESRQNWIAFYRGQRVAPTELEAYVAAVTNLFGLFMTESQRRRRSL